jgi:hypothetical protein
MKKTKEQLLKELICANKRLKRIYDDLLSLSGGAANRSSDHVYYARIYIDGAERSLSAVREE